MSKVKCPKASPGFTLLELVVVIAIIMTFVALAAARFGSISEHAGVMTALEEMNNIKNAITDMFYQDLGKIPEDPGTDDKPGSGDDDRPWYATRYLCLKDDRNIEDKESNVDPDSETNPECKEMFDFLTSQTMSENEIVAKGLLVWNRYRQKGWRGPYMEHDTNGRLAPIGKSQEGNYFPLIATPWSDKCEKLAQQAEEAGDDIDAEKIRRGKYYLVVGGQDKNEARIICFGVDCADSGSFCKDYMADAPSDHVTADDLRKPNIYDSDNPDNPDYYYTGDDIVIFIFGGGVTRH